VTDSVRRLLVTGATGFVGRWVCRMALADNWRVYGLTRSPENLLPKIMPLHGSLLSAQSLERAVEKAAPHAVIHLAGITHPQSAELDVQHTQQINVHGTAQLVKLLSPTTRFVFASSVHVYGIPEVLPITEQHPCNPVGGYALSKRNAERLLEGRKNTCRARCFHLTGPGQSRTYVLSDWFHQYRETGRVYAGNIQVIRDFLDVRDAARAYVMLAGREILEPVVNLCAGKGWSLRHLLKQMQIQDVIIDPRRQRAIDAPAIIGDNKRLQQMGWAPTISITDSLLSIGGSR